MDYGLVSVIGASAGAAWFTADVLYTLVKFNKVMNARDYRDAGVLSDEAYAGEVARIARKPIGPFSYWLSRGLRE